MIQSQGSQTVSNLSNAIRRSKSSNKQGSMILDGLNGLLFINSNLDLGIKQQKYDYSDYVIKSNQTNLTTQMSSTVEKISFLEEIKDWGKPIQIQQEVQPLGQDQNTKNHIRRNFSSRRITQKLVRQSTQWPQSNIQFENSYMINQSSLIRSKKYVSSIGKQQSTINIQDPALATTEVRNQAKSVVLTQRKNSFKPSNKDDKNLDNSINGEVRQKTIGEPPDPPFRIDPEVVTQILNQIHNINTNFDRLMNDQEKFLQGFNDQLKQQMKDVNARFKIISMYEQQELIRLLQSGETDQLDPILSKLRFFDRFSEEIRLRLYTLVSHEEFKANQILFNQGDYGDKLYIIIKGSVEVIYKLGSLELIVSSLYDGQYFGELSLMETKKNQDYSDKLENVKIKNLDQTRDFLFKKMYDAWDKQEKYICSKAIQQYELKNGPIEPKQQTSVVNEITDPGVLQLQQRRTATIRAAEECHCLTLSRKNFQEILLNVMQEELDERISLLKETPILRDFHNFALVPLANQLVLENFELDEIIIREGSIPTKVYIINHGSCYTSRTIKAFRSKKHSKYSKLARQLKDFTITKDNKLLGKKTQSQIELSIPKQNQQKLQDFTVEMYDQERVQYNKIVKYQQYQRGAFLFGRSLYESSASKVNLTSETSGLQIYSLSKEKLEYLPEFLATHLIREFKIKKQIDDDIDPEREDEQNIKWDNYKNQLANRAIYDQANSRGKLTFKRY